MKRTNITILFLASIALVAGCVHIDSPAVTPALPTNTATDSAALAAVWITYSNETYGFTFEYPAAYDQAPYSDSCRVREDSNGIHLGAQSNLVISASGGMRLEEYTDQILSTRDWTVVSRKDETVNGIRAVTVEYRFGGLNRYGTITLIEKDERIFAFNLTAGAFCDIPESGVREFDAFLHMIATFQFTK